jgi:hypothetical protein
VPAMAHEAGWRGATAYDRLGETLEVGALLQPWVPAPLKPP